MKMNRRTFVLAGLGALLVAPAAAWAARPDAAFEAESPEGVLEKLGISATEASEAIEIKAPDIAENGAVVPVSVTTTIPNPTRISILVSTNPLPLTSSYDLSPTSVPYVSTRVKMLQTADVIAVVEADGKTYQASQAVKVTIGGCGGG